MIPEKWTLEGLQAAKFKMCGSVSELQSTSCAKAPNLPGVYVVFRSATGDPAYLTKSDGGHFKGKDPTVDASVLESNWVKGAGVLYVGKAGGSAGDATLRKRLLQYMKFGMGMPIGHWGGRLIWQLADYRDLIVLYKLTLAQEPSEHEDELISAFKKAHGGQRPFANLVGGFARSD